MYIRYLNVLLLYYPFMSNPRRCLGCATQQMWSTVLHFFSCRWFCVPYITTFCLFCVNQQERPNFDPSVYKMYPIYARKEVLFHWGAYRATWFHCSLIKHGWINCHIIALQKRYLRNTFFLFSYDLVYYNLTGYLQRVMFDLSYLIHGDTYAPSIKSCTIVSRWPVFEHWT